MSERRPFPWWLVIVAAVVAAAVAFAALDQAQHRSVEYTAF